MLTTSSDDRDGEPAIDGLWRGADDDVAAGETMELTADARKNRLEPTLEAWRCMADYKLTAAAREEGRKLGFCFSFSKKEMMVLWCTDLNDLFKEKKLII